MIPFKFIAISIFVGVSHLASAATSCSSIADATKRLQCYDTANKKPSANRKIDTNKSFAKKAVLENLKDPDSAKFGKFTLVNSDKACFTVNAKNSLGGYTGDQQALLAKIENIWHVVMIEPKLNHEQCIEVASQLSD